MTKLRDCKQCNKPTINRYFCSRSCVGLYSASHQLKKTPVKSVCPDCGGFKWYQSARCQRCASRYQRRNATKGTVEPQEINRCARTELKWSKRPKKCQMCGFDVVVHVCHIKAVGDFDDNALLSEINHLDNLIYLCPNHHAMFDLGLIQVTPARFELASAP